MSPVPRESPLILVADDEPEIRRLLVTTLRKQGFGEVVEARNGREALELMRSDRPDLVLLDLMMPEVSGWDVLDERRRSSSLAEIPVILISANRGAELANAIGADVSALLPKPFDLDVLHAIVRSTLEPDEDDADPN